MTAYRSIQIFLMACPTQDAIRKITEYLESKGLGAKAVTYRLRDWLISRQRYWGSANSHYLL